MGRISVIVKTSLKIKMYDALMLPEELGTRKSVKIKKKKMHPTSYRWVSLKKSYSVTPKLLKPLT